MSEPIEVTDKLVRQGGRVIVISHIDGWRLDGAGLQVYVDANWWLLVADSPELAQRAERELAERFDPPPVEPERFDQKTMGGLSGFVKRPPSPIRSAT